MSSASFRSQIAGIVSDTLYIILKQFWAPEGKAATAFCSVLGVFWVVFFFFKRKEEKWGQVGIAL